MLLETSEGRKRLVFEVAEYMKRRTQVNIGEVSRNIGEVLGEQYATWVAEVLREAAARTSIEVTGDPGIDQKILEEEGKKPGI